MTYEIESGISIPKPRTGPKKPYRYPWHDLEVGQSFFVPDPPLTKKGLFASVCYVANKRHAPKKFTQRKVDGGLRIWRVE